MKTRKNVVEAVRNFQVELEAEGRHTESATLEDLKGYLANARAC
jgi:hypothetical protein